MLTKVKTTMIDGTFAGGGIERVGPIIVVAAGQSNMVGWTGANNGPLFPMPGVEIWDRSLGQFVTADLRTTTYTVYSGNPGLSVTTVGGGRNNLAVAFAYRLQRETGREVRIVFNATGARAISNWIGNGKFSTDWLALEADLEAAGIEAVDYFLWQQGEADADISTTTGVYRGYLSTLLNQIRNSAWGGSAVVLAGKPVQSWTPEKVAYLNSEIEAFAAENSGVGAVSSYALTQPSYAYPDTGDTIHYTGRSLYSLGYYNYYAAIPAGLVSQRSIVELMDEYPWPDSAYGYSNRPALVRTSHLGTLSRYNLAPSIAKTGSRIWVGYTANLTKSGEGAGQHARLVWTDDNFATIKGLTGTGLGITGPNPAEPCLWAAPDGALWCFFMTAMAGEVFDGYAGVWYSVCRNPNTSNPRFSAPQRITKFGWTQPPQYFNGAWHLPVSYWRGGPYIPPTFVPALVGQHYFKLDWVNAKAEYSFTVADYLGIDIDNFDEQNIVEASSGRLWATWRTLEGPYESLSGDGGKTWDTPAPATSVFGVDRPVSRHRFINTPTDRLCVAWCDAANSRSNLTLSIGNIGGSTTNTQSVVIQSGTAAYPDILCADGNIYVVYDEAARTTGAGGGSGGKIRVGRVSESALVAGTATVTTFTIDPGT